MAAPNPNLYSHKLFPCKLNVALFDKILTNCKKKKSEVVRALKNSDVLQNEQAYAFLGGRTPSNAAAFGVVGACLGREATAFMDHLPDPVAADKVVEVFAQRLEELILNGAIPPTYKTVDGREEMTDVVDYVWQLGDVGLSSIPITFRQQREAYDLVKRWDLLEEWSLEETCQGIPRLIGRFTIAPVDKALVIHDLSQRKHLEKEAIRLLRETPSHWVKVQRRFHPRYCEYAKHASVDGVKPLEVDCEPVIKHDWECRRALLISGADETALAARYRHSRFALSILGKHMLDADKQFKTDTFLKFWKGVLRRNTRNLERIGDALGAEGVAPDFVALGRAVASAQGITQKLVDKVFNNASKLFGESAAEGG